jgi:hypothetical protein
MVANASWVFFELLLSVRKTLNLGIVGEIDGRSACHAPTQQE